MMDRSASRGWLARGSGATRIIAFNAVGNRKVCVTWWRSMSFSARSASKRAREATIVRPKYSVGSSASHRPPVQAQSAGLQNGPVPWNQFWLATKPLRLPMSARCGITAPLAGPVVPLV